MKIRLHLEVSSGVNQWRGTRTALFEKVVTWETMPSVGDLLILTTGGWETEVIRIWWDATPAGEPPTVEMQEKISPDDERDLFASLHDAGWSES